MALVFARVCERSLRRGRAAVMAVGAAAFFAITAAVFAVTGGEGGAEGGGEKRVRAPPLARAVHLGAVALSFDAGLSVAETPRADKLVSYPGERRALGCAPGALFRLRHGRGRVAGHLHAALQRPLAARPVPCVRGAEAAVRRGVDGGVLRVPAHVAAGGGARRLGSATHAGSRGGACVCLPSKCVPPLRLEPLDLACATPLQAVPCMLFSLLGLVTYLMAEQMSAEEDGESFTLWGGDASAGAGHGQRRGAGGASRPSGESRGGQGGMRAGGQTRLDEGEDDEEDVGEEGGLLLRPGAAASRQQK